MCNFLDSPGLRVTLLCTHVQAYLQKCFVCLFSFSLSHHPKFVTIDVVPLFPVKKQPLILKCLSLLKPANKLAFGHHRAYFLCLEVRKKITYARCLHFPSRHHSYNNGSCNCPKQRHLQTFILRKVATCWASLKVLRTQQTTGLKRNECHAVTSPLQRTNFQTF